MPQQNDFMARKKATLLVPSGPTGMHLFVIITNPCPNGFHLLLPISSVKAGIAHDEACVFDGGEHPFVDRKSFVLYRAADQKRQDMIERGVIKGLFIPKVDMPDEPFAAICAGIVRSDFIKPWAVEFYQRYCNV